METAKPSRTAFGVAFRRATHQLHDAPPHILSDPIAVPLLGPSVLADLEAAKSELDAPGNLSLRAWLVARSRYAEDALAQAVSQGVNQYVLLGAGLDTFAHRNPHPHLRVFEVDHPATQQWKRQLVTAAQLPHQPSLTYVPINFENEVLAHQLTAAGFKDDAPAFIAMLGVVLYLTLPALQATLAYLAARPPSSGLVFDYTQPRSVLPPAEQTSRDLFDARVARIGEPHRLSFTPPDIARELPGFANLEDLGANELNALYFAGRTDNLRIHGLSARLLSAWL
jgi:methyltransferase (TIGR00027 family)